MKPLILALAFLPSLALAANGLPMSTLRADVASRYNVAKQAVRINGTNFRVLGSGGPIIVGQPRKAVPVITGTINRTDGKTSHVWYSALPFVL